jgi:hypothetical protein
MVAVDIVHGLKRRAGSVSRRKPGTHAADGLGDLVRGLVERLQPCVVEADLERLALARRPRRSALPMGRDLTKSNHAVTREVLHPLPGNRAVARKALDPLPGNRAVARKALHPLPGNRAVTRKALHPLPGNRAVIRKALGPLPGNRAVTRKALGPLPGNRAVDDPTQVGDPAA